MSTRLLCGIFAAILLLAILHATLVDTKGVLRRDSCTIAAVSSFLADSDILRCGADTKGRGINQVSKLQLLEISRKVQKVATIL